MSGVAPNGKNGPVRSHPVSPEVQALLDRWMRRHGPGAAGPDASGAPRTRGGEPAAPAPSPSTAAPDPDAPRRALRALAVRGPLVHFPPDPNPVVLTPTRSGWQHRGTMAARGPCAPPTVLGELGLTPAQVSAFEFVAAWFGAPFDAVSLRAGPALSWGIWHLRGRTLGLSLWFWRERAPVAFAGALSRFGLGVEPVRDGAGAVCGGALSLAGRGGAILRGSAAEREIRGDPRLVAVLARAARDPDARAAQLTAVARLVLQPTLAIRLPSPAGAAGPSLGERLSRPRGLAVAFLAHLHRGATGVAELSRLIGPAPLEAGEDALLQGYAAALEQAGRMVEASRTRRALLSPELDGG